MDYLFLFFIISYPHIKTGIINIMPIFVFHLSILQFEERFSSTCAPGATRNKPVIIIISSVTSIMCRISASIIFWTNGTTPYSRNRGGWGRDMAKFYLPWYHQFSARQGFGPISSNQRTNMANQIAHSIFSIFLDRSTQWLGQVVHDSCKKKKLIKLRG